MIDVTESRKFDGWKSLFESVESRALLRGRLGAELVRVFGPGLEVCGVEPPVPEELDDALEVRSLLGGSEARKGFDDFVRLVFDLCRCSPSEDVWMGNIPTSPDAIIMPFQALSGLLDRIDDADPAYGALMIFISTEETDYLKVMTTVAMAADELDIMRCGVW